MDLDSKEICSILEFWREIEILSPFEVKEDLLAPRKLPNHSSDSASVYRWDAIQRGDSKTFDDLIQEIPDGEEQSERMNLYTVCLGVIQTDDYIKKIVEILRRENHETDAYDFDLRYSETVTPGKICLANFKVNHFGKVLHWTFNPSYALCWLIQKKIDEKQGRSFADVDATREDLLDQFKSLCKQNLQNTGTVTEVDTKDKDKVVYDILYGKMQEGKRRLIDLRPQKELRVTSGFINTVCRYLCDMTGIASNYAVWVVTKGMKSPRMVFDDFFNSPYIKVLKAMEDAIREGNLNKLLSGPLKRFFQTANNQPNKKDVLLSPANLYEIVNPLGFNFGRWPAPIGHRLACLQQLAIARMRQTEESGEPIMAINGPPGTGKTTLLRELIADIVVERAISLSKIEDIKEVKLFDSLSDGCSTMWMLKREYCADSAVIVASHTNRAVENITKEFPLQYDYENVSREKADYFGSLANKLLGKKEAWALISVALGQSANWSRVRSALFGIPKGQADIGNAKAANKESKEESSDQAIKDNNKSNLRLVFEEETEKEGGYDVLAEKWLEEKVRFIELHEKVRQALKRAETQFEEDVQGAVLKKKKPRSKKGHDIDIGALELNEEKLKLNLSAKENIQSHLDPLYMDQELDEKRTELFLSALRLHKLTILIHAERFLAAIKDAFTMMMRYDSTPISIRALETFAFFCPVISTTFASSPLRFTKYSTGTLPWVIVDEASQVSPQSALTLMQRAKRFIVMGDPKQLEPVVPLPQIVTEMLSRKNPVLEKWSPHNVSLQTLCDGTQVYGAWIGKPNEGLWTGFPLRVHRRCFSPMFDISNEISYNGQMIQGVELKDKEKQKDFVPSFWLDVVPSEPSTTNAVPEEIEAASEVLSYIFNHQMQKQLSADQQPKTIMLCSPFRAQVKQLNAMVKIAGLPRDTPFLKVSKIGTVHTMQGQQASIMILVLGSRTGENGQGARLWATSPANLINVAVSRGVETLIVIGNFNDWCEIGAISEITYQLKLHGLGVRQKLPDLDID